MLDLCATEQRKWPMRKKNTHTQRSPRCYVEWPVQQCILVNGVAINTHLINITGFNSEYIAIMMSVLKCQPVFFIIFLVRLVMSVACTCKCISSFNSRYAWHKKWHDIFHLRKMFEIKGSDKKPDIYFKYTLFRCSKNKSQRDLSGFVLCHNLPVFGPLWAIC